MPIDDARQTNGPVRPRLTKLKTQKTQEQERTADRCDQRYRADEGQRAIDR